MSGIVLVLGRLVENGYYRFVLKCVVLISLSRWSLEIKQLDMAFALNLALNTEIQ